MQDKEASGAFSHFVHLIVFASKLGLSFSTRYYYYIFLLLVLLIQASLR